MAHVQIKRKDNGAFVVIVDGVDLSHEILAEGFGITFADEHWLPARVTMTLAADTLDLDLPESVVEALRSDDDATRRPAKPTAS